MAVDWLINRADPTNHLPSPGMILQGTGFHFLSLRGGLTSLDAAESGDVEMTIMEAAQERFLDCLGL